ncbi:hypothetical protein NPIL_19711 [Nephila pilipes]|uniref:Uncharacterized protein n=1 Tax=Nephila pilipes TaxID=299642 RepID=A0A8X6PPU3_NEPPI|nr:hypothetical protein NPIL_19711 [Nephila pilipes]
MTSDYSLYAFWHPAIQELYFSKITQFPKVSKTISRPRVRIQVDAKPFQCSVKSRVSNTGAESIVPNRTSALFGLSDGSFTFLTIMWRRDISMCCGFNHALKNLVCTYFLS